MPLPTDKRKEDFMQDTLRLQVRLAKAYNEDIYYKDFANYLDISEAAFYNWLNSSYELSKEKATKLRDVVIDLI